MKPNPFSDIAIMTQQQAIFWFNIACNNHNPDGTDYDMHRFYIMYYPHFKILTVQQSNIERTSRIKQTRYLHVDHIQLALMVDFVSKIPPPPPSARKCSIY